MLGIILGAYTCNYLYVSRMHWIYTKPEDLIDPHCNSKLRTLAEKFKPNVWTRYNWGVFSNLRNYGAVVFYCFFVLAVDCNNFFLKYIIWVPPEHTILKVRLAIWAISAIASTKEFYEFITNRYCKRIGPFMWLTCFTLLIEFSIMIKFGRVIFHEPFPWYVKLIWGLLGQCMILGGIYAYRNQLVDGVRGEEKAYDP